VVKSAPVRSLITHFLRVRRIPKPTTHTSGFPDWRMENPETTYNSSTKSCHSTTFHRSVTKTRTIGSALPAMLMGPEDFTHAGEERWGWGGLLLFGGQTAPGSWAGEAPPPQRLIAAGFPDSHVWFQPWVAGAIRGPDCLPCGTSAECAQQKRKADALEAASPKAAALTRPKRRMIKHVRACVQCGRSKVKCDGDRPCAKCMLRGIAEACSSQPPAANAADNDQANAGKRGASARNRKLEKGPLAGNEAKVKRLSFESSHELELLAEAASRFAERETLPCAKVR